MRLLSRFALAAFALLVCSTSSASFVINEIDPDTVGADLDEFIELKGNPNEVAPAGMQVVWFNGGTTTGATARAYRVTDISGIAADSNGYLVIGTSTIAGAQVVVPGNTLQNGEDAVALYSSGTFTTGGSGSVPTSANLVDYIIYEAGADPDAGNWNLFGGPVVVYNESLFNSPTLRSLSRIPNGTGSWQPAEPSPKAANYTKPGLATPANPLDLGRTNQIRPAEVRLNSNGTAPVTITGATLDPSTSAGISVVGTFPRVLDISQTTGAACLLQVAAASNGIYGGTVNLTTDVPSSPTVSVPFIVELVRVTQTSTAGAVKINEICYNPGTTDHNKDGATTGQADEYVELYNTTGSPIAIEGWEVACIDSDSTGTVSTGIFPAGATIPAGGWATLFTNGTPTGFSPATAYSAGLPARIRNIGAYVTVKDGTNFLDKVAFLAAEDTPDTDGYTNMNHTVAVAGGGSVGRRPDGANTFRSFSITDTTLTDRPSPNTTNAATAASDWSMFE